MKNLMQLKKQLRKLNKENLDISIELGLLQAKCGMLSEFDTKTHKFKKYGKTVFEKLKMAKVALELVESTLNLNNEAVFCQQVCKSALEKIKC